MRQSPPDEGITRPAMRRVRHGGPGSRSACRARDAPAVPRRGHAAGAPGQVRRENAGLKQFSGDPGRSPARRHNGVPAAFATSAHRRHAHPRQPARRAEAAGRHLARTAAGSGPRVRFHRQPRETWPSSPHWMAERFGRARVRERLRSRGPPSRSGNFAAGPRRRGGSQPRATAAAAPRGSGERRTTGRSPSRTGACRCSSATR